MAKPGPFLLLVLTAAVPGCFLFDDCGATTDITWTQPDLGPLGNVTPGAVFQPGDGRLPWTNPWTNLTGLRLAGIGLDLATPAERQERLLGYATPMVLHIGLHGTGNATTSTDGEVPETELIEAFHRLAANLTAAPIAEVDAAARSFAASRRDSGVFLAEPDGNGGYREIPVLEHDAAMPGPLRLDGFVAGFGLAEPLPYVSGPGGASLEAAPWSFTFSLPTWRITDGDDSLVFDALGHAMYSGTPRDDEARFKRDAQDFAGKHGLPRFEIDDVEAGGYIC